MAASDSPALPGSVPAVWGNVPQRIKNFTGREDILVKLRESPAKVRAVLPEDPLPHALQGQGGVGKTAVAIEYAHRYRSEYQLVWWIPSDQLALVRSSLAALALPLGLRSASAAGIETAAAAVRDALRKGEPYRRWLLIFDNADQPEDLEPLIPYGPGDVLITSRNHRWQSVSHRVPIDVFTREESTAFLIKRVPKGLSEHDADRLADKLGDLPLALEQAGAVVAETGMPVDDYLRLVDQETRKILAEGKSPEYPVSMTAAWAISVSALQERMPQALEVLRCCAFFGPDPIPREIFRASMPAPGSRVDDVIADTILLSRAIRELGRLALVKIDGPKLSIHRLIQALLRDGLDPDERNSYRHDAHAILAAGGPKDPTDSRLWPRYAELVAHVVSPATDMAHCLVQEHRAFALEVVRYLYISGDLASCRLFAERFIKQWTEDSSPDDPTVLDARRHLGNALRELGDYSNAFVIIQDTLQNSERILGPTEPLTLALRNSFGADLRARGDFVAARELDEETLHLHQGEFGESAPQTLRVMNNVAHDYGLNANYLQAKELHQKVLRLSDAVAAGVSPSELLTVRTGLARDLRLCGNFSEARDVGEDAYDFGRAALGAEHYLTLRAANDLSIALRRIPAAHEDGFELAREIFDLSRRLLGEKHQDTMAAAISLSNIQRTMEMVDEALVLAKETVNSYPGIYGREHPYYYGCTGNLALLLRLAGDPAAARQLNEAALKGLDRTLTRDHFYSLTVAINLASDLAALGETTAARALSQDSLDRSRLRFGDLHPLTLGCAANLVLDLRAEGADMMADHLLEETLTRYAATLGADHSEAKDAAAGKRLSPDFDPPPI
jgi:tetratricopeptide (TPR) repeat protein